MELDNKLKKAIFFNSKITLLLSETDEIDQEKYDSFEDLIKPINQIFGNQKFRFKFESDLFAIERSENNMFLSGLIENLIIYLNYIADNFEKIQAHDDDKLSNIQNTLATIEFISKFDMTKQVVLINSGIIIEILKLLDNEAIRFSFEAISFTKKILSIVLNFSKHKFYEKIDFLLEYPLVDALDLLQNLRQSNRLDEEGMQLIQLIEKNLKSNSIESCLIKFKTNLGLSDKRIESIVKDETFYDDLRLLSITLNNDCNTDFYWDLFKKYDSSALFTKLLEFMFDISKEELLPDNLDDDDHREIFHRIFRDILEIVFQLVQKSYKFKQLFLDEGMFMLFIKFFENIKLVEFLLEAYVNTLSKIMSNFFLLCRKLYYIDDISLYVQDKIHMFKVLIEARNSIENSSTKEESLGLQEKPIFRMFLICLAYLGKKFEVETLTTKHYEIIASRGFIPKTFKAVSNEFQSHTEKIKWEFINESNQLEVEEVSRLLIGGTTSTAINTIVDALTCLRIIYTSHAAKKIAYENYSYFMKSILFYGLEIEIIICLACLKKYCSSLDWIRKDIFEDRKLIDHLSELYHLNFETKDDAMKKRLNATILDFFNANGFKHEILRKSNSCLEFEISNLSIKK